MGSGILKGYKTYIVGSLSIAGFLAGYLMGDIDLAAAAQGIVTAALGMTIRNGIANAAK